MYPVSVSACKAAFYVRPKRLFLFVLIRWKLHNQNLNLPPHIRTSFPKDLFDRIEKSFGTSKAISICNILNEEAPTILRINPLKITRDRLCAYLLNKGESQLLQSLCWYLVQEGHRQMSSHGLCLDFRLDESCTYGVITGRYTSVSSVS